MPKFFTYQRPAAVNKQNWNGGSKPQPLPKKAPMDKPMVLSKLEALLKR